jgi:hypothetical protein
MIAFHLDESTKNAIAITLRQRGIDITTTHDAKLLGASDEIQLRYACENNRILVTHDNDFLRLHHLHVPHTGIAYCKPRHRSVGEIIRSLTFLWRSYKPEELYNQVIFL